MKITIKDFRIFDREEILDSWTQEELQNLKAELESWKGKELTTDNIKYIYAYKNENTHEVVVIFHSDFAVRIKSDFCKKHGLSDEIASCLDIGKINQGWDRTDIDRIIEFDCTLTPDNY